MVTVFAVGSGSPVFGVAAIDIRCWRSTAFAALATIRERATYPDTLMCGVGASNEFEIVRATW
jgi:hypothetical protein